MSRLQHKVNILPVIAKADSMTQLECDAFKEQLRADIQVLVYSVSICISVHSSTGPSA